MNDVSRHDLDTLKSRVDLAELMRSFGIDLKPEGRNLKACCPWHEDKTPSLVLNPAKQLYNCFGCEAKGDVLDFLRQNEGLSFGAAVARLRELAGEAPAAERQFEKTRDPDRLPGVIGSRMTGAGFGGSTVSLLKNDAIETFRERVSAVYTERIGYAPSFYVASIAEGTHRLV